LIVLKQNAANCRRPVKPKPDRRPEITQVTRVKVVDFSSFSANQQTVGTDPGEILIRRKIKDRQLIAKLQVSEDLAGLGLLLL
jgi:hypothetical protein